MTQDKRPLGREAAQFVQAATEAGGPPLSAMSPDQARAAIAAMLTLGGDRPEMPSADHRLAVTGGTILLRLLTPPDPKAVIVFLHGGGFVTGTADQHDTVGRQIAAATGCMVVIPDYRLAPEHRFPTGLNDCLTAVDWAGSLGLPVVVMGDSAGGNLAAVVAQSRPVAAQVLIYPVLDLGMDTASYHDPANQLLLTREAGAWFWDHYLAPEARRDDPRISPLRAADLAGLPPTVMVLASHDILRDEGLAYAARLTAAGVPCDLHMAEGEIHGFFVLGAVMPAAKPALAFVADRLRTILT